MSNLRGTSPFRLFIILTSLFFSLLLEVSASAGIRSKSNHQPASTVTAEKVIIKLADRDRKRMEVLEIAVLVRLHSLLMAERLNTLLSKGGPPTWTAAQAVFEETAATSTIFAKQSNNASLSNYFTAVKDTFDQQAALSKEINSKRLERYLDEYLKVAIIANSGLGWVPVKTQHTPIFKLYFGKWNKIQSQRESAVNSAISGIVKDYQIDFNQFATSNQPFPVRSPLQEFQREHEYIYDSLIRDAGLPKYLEFYYQRDFEQILGRALVKIGLPSSEVGLFFANLWVTSKSLPTNAGAILSPEKIKIIRAGNFLMDATIDCLKSEKDKRQREFYEEGVDLHQKIIEELTANDKIVTRLQAFLVELPKLIKVYPTVGETAVAIKNLNMIVEIHLADRKKLQERVKRNEVAAQNMLQKSNQGELDIANELSEALVRLRVARTPEALRAMMKESPCQLRDNVQRRLMGN
jgi:hypothetical protein